MKNRLAQLKKYRFEILLSFLTILLVFSPYIRADLIVGSDSPFHLARIETLKQNLLYGIFPTKLHVDLCYGYGYGTGFFYPDFFLYIPAFLRVLGLSLEVSFKLFAGLIQAGIYFSVYYCVYRLTHDRFASLCSAIVYLFSNQVLVSFYYDFTLGTSLGLIFIPLAICGMYLFLYRDQSPCMLGVGFTGLILSHVLSTALALSVCTILLLIQLVKRAVPFRKFVSLAAAVVLVSGLTACFWLPMMEQFSTQKFHVSQPWTYVDDNTFPLVNLFFTNGLGWILTAAIFLLGFSIIIPPFSEKDVRVSTDRPEQLRLFYFSGLFFLILPLCGHFWRLFRTAFQFLQFPKRLFVPASILIVFAFGTWLGSLSHRLCFHQRHMITLTLFLASLYLGMNYLSPRIDSTEDFGERVIYKEIAGLGSGEEWLPLETTREHLIVPAVVTSDTGDILPCSRINGITIFHPAGSAEYYDIPLIWYKGYTAVSSDQHPLKLTKNPENGLIRVWMEKDINADSVSIHYVGTPLQYFSYLISVVTLCGIIIKEIYLKIRHRNG